MHSVAVGVCRDPLVGLLPGRMVAAPLGVPIESLQPPSSGLTLCNVNGEWLARESWPSLTRPGDVIVWHVDLPQREEARYLLQIAAIALAFAGQAYATAALWASVANVAYNILVPPRVQTLEQAPPAIGVYSTSLAGNAARLDSPIPKVCGRVKYSPAFAGQPYKEYLPSDPDNPEKDRDEYLYVILCLGHGDVQVEKAFIGKTSVTHFQDIVVAQRLAPGEQPTRAKANVVTVEEVADLELKDGRYVGGYAASRPGDLVDAIGVDVGALQGLGNFATIEEEQDELEDFYNAPGAIEISWQVEVREINDYGVPVSEWQVLANETRKAFTNTPQRWSFLYELATPIRPEVRLVRTTPTNNRAEARDSITWLGLRAHLNKPAPLSATATHYELVMRASEQLSPYSQRDISMILRGQARKWHPDTGWGAYEFNRNWVWWLVDLWSDAEWGQGLPDSRIDLLSLYELSLTADARQDRFDYVFTDARDVWEVAQMMARSGRSRAFRRGPIFTAARDEWVPLPVAAITPRITEVGSMRMTTKLPGLEQPDGYLVQYLSNVTWDTASIECPCPGFSVSNSDDPRFDPLLPPMQNPVYLTLDGITGAFHAEREGLYNAADMALRTSTVSATVEMEGALLAYMDTVRWMPELPGYGQAGDVAFWDEPTLVMGLTEPPDFSTSPYLTLVRPDGTLTSPVAVSPGPTAWDVTLPAAPDFALVLDDAARERPKYLLGPIDSGDEIAKIAALSDGGLSDDGARLVDVTGAVDVEAVHLADNHLLPGPGDIQDPIDDGEDFSTGGGVATLVRLTANSWESAAGASSQTRVSLNADGTLSFIQVGNTPASGVKAGQWLTTSPVDPSAAEAFEVMATGLTHTGGGTVTGTFDTWLQLGVADRFWEIAGQPTTAQQFGESGVRFFDGIVFHLRIRRVGQETILTERLFALNIVDNS